GLPDHLGARPPVSSRTAGPIEHPAPAPESRTGYLDLFAMNLERARSAAVSIKDRQQRPRQQRPRRKRLLSLASL
ncbi:MAG TPA: hypothetical protein VK001_09350, partial [Geminicoccaceae bacterium]|nr:hypothetical protein [Geminicoccaceae bacterium]